MAPLARAPVDVVLTDFRLPGSDGLALVKQVQALSAQIPVVVLTGQGTIASAVECLKSGASDYLLKPADPEALEVALTRAMAARGPAARGPLPARRGGARSASPSARARPGARALEMVDAAAATDSVVLLRGESGTGKELLARRLHQKSPRAGGPYVRVNCAAVPTEMWESEFFGHRKGSFTGASADRDGWFLLAHRGTLFLDEVGAMPLATQAKLLRAIQDGEFHRLGDEQPTRVDVRIVAATNADLEAAVKEGRFRGRPLLPAERPAHRGAAAARAARRHPAAGPRLRGRGRRARLGRPAPELDADDRGPPARLRLARQRARAAQRHRAGARAPSRARPGRARPGAGAGGLPGAAATPPARRRPADDLNLRDNLDRLERSLILEAHRRSDGVRREAARLLGIDPRNLAYYFRKHGLDPDAAADQA